MLKRMIMPGALALMALCAQADDEVYVQTVKVPAGSSAEDIVKLSTQVVPHPRQMTWHKDEFIAFIHFGPNSFSGREWGSGNEDPKMFKPVGMDTDQWCDVMKKAGMTRVILTVKHHEGFCLWPTRYTAHSVASSTEWRGGKGDVLRDLSKSCDRYGLKLGVYLSPADLYMNGPGELYGNDSKPTKRTIPRPVDGRPFNDKQTFSYDLDDYNEYFMNQLFELLTEYGKIHELWFDGAKPKSKAQSYNYTAWFEMIRTLAPDAMIFGKGPDTRWCGNEGGNTRSSEFNVIPLPVDKFEDEQWNDRRSSDLGGRKRLSKAKWLHYYPAETNTSIRHGWFYRDDEHQSVRTADDTFDIYERAVGGNSVFLLNIPPNREGKFSKRDVDCLIEVGKRIRTVYHENLNAGASGPSEVLDGDENTFWQPEGLTGEFEIKLPKPITTNRVALREALETKGQRVENHALDVWVNGAWQEVVTAGAVGYQRILRFPVVESDRFKVRITGSRATPTVSKISFHFYNEPPHAVHVNASNSNSVSLACAVAPFSAWHASVNDTKSQKIYYTLDGSDPTAQSKLFNGDFEMPKGGIVKARTIIGDRMGPVSTKKLGCPTDKWKLVEVDSNQELKQSGPAKAFDGGGRYWLSQPADGEHFITIDTGSEIGVAGFTYQPPGDKGKRGFVERYRFEGSLDGKKWFAVKEGEIGNIVNDPSKRSIYFDRKVKIRYFKFVGVKSAVDNTMGIGEIGLLSERL